MEKIEAWKAKDGKVYEDENVAKDIDTAVDRRELQSRLKRLYDENSSNGNPYILEVISLIPDQFIEVITTFMSEKALEAEESKIPF
jgi:hypothetical protein